MFTLISANWTSSSCTRYISWRNPLPLLGILFALRGSGSGRDTMPYFIRAQNCQQGVFSTPPPKNHPAFSQLTSQSNSVGVGTLLATLTQEELGFVSPQEDSKGRKPWARAAVPWV